jgi:hypothetical protein
MAHSSKIVERQAVRQVFAVVSDSSHLRWVMTSGHSVLVAGPSGAVGQGYPNVLHHTLVFMVEDVTVKDKIANIPTITGTQNHRVLPWWLPRWNQILYPQGVFPNTFQ